MSSIIRFPGVFFLQAYYKVLTWLFVVITKLKELSLITYIISNVTCKHNITTTLYHIRNMKFKFGVNWI